VKIGVDSKFYLKEKKWIDESAAEWNAVANPLAGRPLFQLEEITPGSSSTPSGSSICGFATTEQGFGILTVTSDELWKELGLEKENPAVTVRCTGDSTFVSKQVVLVNV